MRGDETAVRLLTRHFLRRLLDNDLISPHADRHDSVAVQLAVVVSVAVFVTFFLSMAYLAAFIQLPGQTVLSALSNRFLFISASIAVSALAALMVWDALSLEARDAAILGPLPIPGRVITRAKLAAALVFGVVFTIALNGVPSVLYPAFLTLNLHGVGGAGILRLIGAHATSVMLAGLFGFFGVLAVRGLLRLILGERRFGRLSGPAQSLLIMCAVTALILTPTVRGSSVLGWLGGAFPPRWPVVPVLWYLGVNERLAGDVVANAPIGLPPRVVIVERLKRLDEEGRTAYRALGGNIAALAQKGLLAFPLAALLAVVTFLWNNRRLPESSGDPPPPSRTRVAFRAMGEWLTRANPETQAGFFFTLQTLTRSGPHRLIVALSLAGALTLPFTILLRTGANALVELQSMSVGLLAIQTMVVLALLAGLRYAVTVPAELASNWTIRMAWRGDERGYLAGVKRAAMVVLVALPLLLLLPLHVALFGPVVALIHALYGFLFGLAALDAFFLGYRKLPFACSYVPLENLKLLWSGGAVTFLLVTYGFAQVERLALLSPLRTALFVAVLGGVVIVTQLADRVHRRDRVALDFDEGPAPATQRLGIFDRMAVRD
jgi:hypothetical protein